jgi:hypothetical protein
VGMNVAANGSDAGRLRDEGIDDFHALSLAAANAPCHAGLPRSNQINTKHGKATQEMDDPNAVWLFQASHQR